MRNHAFLYLLLPDGEPGDFELLAEANSTWPVLWRILFARTLVADARRVLSLPTPAAPLLLAADAQAALSRFDRVVHWLTRAPQIADTPDVMRYLHATQRHLRASVEAYAVSGAPVLCADLTAFSTHEPPLIERLSARAWQAFEAVECAPDADASALLCALAGMEMHIDTWRTWADTFGLALFAHPYFAESFRQPHTDDYRAAPLPSMPATDATWPHRHGYAVVLRAERYGYVDEQGHALVHAQFDAADDFTAHGVARVCQRRRYGLLRADGSFAVPLDCDEIEWRCELGGWLCRRGPRCTLVHADGSAWISAPYDAIEMLVPQRLLRARRGAWMGALQWSGAPLHLPFSSIEALEPHIEGGTAAPAHYLRVYSQPARSRPKAGVWDIDAARLVVPCEYDFVCIALLDGGGRFGFIVANKTAYAGAPRADRHRIGVLDEHGQPLVAPTHAWLAVKADLSKAGALERVREALYWAWSRGEPVAAGIPDSEARVWWRADGTGGERLAG